MKGMESKDHSGRGPRMALALGSAPIVVLGLVVVARDVIVGRESGTGWAPLIVGGLGLVAAGIWRAIDDARGVASDRAPADRLEGAGEGEAGARTLRWIAAGAGLFLLAQALIPLRYYLGSDPYDERFAWRMFSDVRLQECGVRATEVANGSERIVPLQRTIHVAWITTLRRNRSAAVRRYLRWRCEQGGVTSARLQSDCVTPEGERLPPLVRTIDCASGEIEGALE